MEEEDNSVHFIIDISTKPEKFGDLDDVAVPVSTRIKNARR